MQLQGSVPYFVRPHTVRPHTAWNRRSVFNGAHSLAEADDNRGHVFNNADETEQVRR